MKDAIRIIEEHFMTPEFEERVKREAMEETVRQIIHGLPPSDGLPDMRPHYPRYDETPTGDMNTVQEDRL